MEQDLNRVKRRINRYINAGLFNELDVTIKRAITRDELIQSYKLVHDIFLERGYILEKPNKTRIRKFEISTEMATFIAKKENDIIAVLSVVADSKENGLPSDKSFKKEIDQLRETYKTCEITNLVVSPTYRNASIFLELTRIILAQMEYKKYECAFISISEEHQPFFENVLLFEPYGEKRSYSDEKIDYVIGMKLDLTVFDDNIKKIDNIVGNNFLSNYFVRDNKYFNVVPNWDIDARKEFNLTDDLINSN